MNGPWRSAPGERSPPRGRTARARPRGSSRFSSLLAALARVGAHHRTPAPRAVSRYATRPTPGVSTPGGPRARSSPVTIRVDAGARTTIDRRVIRFSQPGHFQPSTPKTRLSSSAQHRASSPAFRTRFAALLTKRSSARSLAPGFVRGGYLRHHLRPPGPIPREHPAVEHLVRPRRGDQRGQPLRELLCAELHRRRPVDPDALLWRDLGYAIGALLAGIVADAFGVTTAVWLVAGLTMASGAVVAIRMRETLALKLTKEAA